jgi:hypothetical protein
MGTLATVRLVHGRQSSEHSTLCTFDDEGPRSKRETHMLTRQPGRSLYKMIDQDVLEYMLSVVYMTNTWARCWSVCVFSRTSHMSW